MRFGKTGDIGLVVVGGNSVEVSGIENRALFDLPCPTDCGDVGNDFTIVDSKRKPFAHIERPGKRSTTTGVNIEAEGESTEFEMLDEQTGGGNSDGCGCEGRKLKLVSGLMAMASLMAVVGISYGLVCLIDNLKGQ